MDFEVSKLALNYLFRYEILSLDRDFLFTIQFTLVAWEFFARSQKKITLLLYEFLRDSEIFEL